MTVVTSLSAVGVDVLHKDGTRYLLSKAQFPASTSNADLETKLQSLLDQHVNPKLDGEHVVVHVFSRSPVRIALAAFRGSVRANWWREPKPVTESL